MKRVSDNQSCLNTEIHAIQKMARTRYCSLIRRLTFPPFQVRAPSQAARRLAKGKYLFFVVSYVGLILLYNNIKSV